MVASQHFVSPQEFPELPPLGYISGEVLWMHWTKQLTAALIFAAAGVFVANIDWGETVVWSPHYYQGQYVRSSEAAIHEMEDACEIRDLINSRSWIEGFSAHPRPYPAFIYRFRFSIDQSFIWLCHHFYNSFEFYIGLRASDTTAKALLQMAEQ